MARAPGRGRNPPVLKRYGQHFLNDKRILTAIVDALDPRPSDTVVEIGPGRGSLTEILAQRSGRLIAIEIDRALAEQLKKKFAGNPTVEIVQDDVLEADIHSFAGNDFLLIGNVPYYITTPILFNAMEPPIPRRSVFLVQREVAERMAALPGSESYGALTVNIAAVASVEISLAVDAQSFEPPPKVDSSVVVLTPKRLPLVDVDSLESFRRFVQASFSLRRKQMQRVLRTVRGLSPSDTAHILAQSGIDPSSRPEVLSPEEFAHLFIQLSS